jgi:hypothetical protein
MPTSSWFRACRVSISRVRGGQMTWWSEMDVRGGSDGMWSVKWPAWFGFGQDWSKASGGKA